MTYRVLVTGSRDWTNRLLVYTVLKQVSDAHPDGLVVVHGACPTGADWMAHQWVAYTAPWAPVTEEPHPADWDGLGRAAGMIRNGVMVSLGADECHAFIGPCTSPRCKRTYPHPSHGATHCADLAERAGIPVRRWHT